MRKCCAASIVIMAAVLALPVALPAQAPPAQSNARMAAAKPAPDLSGTWFRDAPILPSGHHARNFTDPENEPPMQPWAAARYNAARKLRFNMDDPRGPDEINPSLYPFCIPPSMPAVYGSNLFEIMQSPGHVYVIFEDTAVQRIYTDGRKNLEGGPRTFMGHSIGKWDGNDLVVDTVDLVGLDGWAWIDSMGHPYTEALHVTQRFRRPSHDRLEVDFILDDPKTYTKPWGGTRYFVMKPNSDPRWEAMEAHGCEDLAQKEFLKKVKSQKAVP